MLSVITSRLLETEKSYILCLEVVLSVITSRRQIKATILKNSLEVVLSVITSRLKNGISQST